jgi:hypothetical protein
MLNETKKDRPWSTIGIIPKESTSIASNRSTLNHVDEKGKSNDNAAERMKE